MQVIVVYAASGSEDSPRGVYGIWKESMKVVLKDSESLPNELQGLYSQTDFGLFVLGINKLMKKRIGLSYLSGWLLSFALYRVFSPNLREGGLKSFLD